MSEYFQDPDPGQDWEIGALLIWGGDYIDAVQVIYRERSTNALSFGYKHGGGGGGLGAPYDGHGTGVQIALQAGEYITQINFNKGNYVDSLTVYSSMSGPWSAGGSGGSPQPPLVVNAGEEMIGFSGWAGDYIDSIDIVLR